MYYFQTRIISAVHTHSVRDDADEGEETFSGSRRARDPRRNTTAIPTPPPEVYVAVVENLNDAVQEARGSSRRGTRPRAG